MALRGNLLICSDSEFICVFRNFTRDSGGGTSRRRFCPFRGSSSFARLRPYTGCSVLFCSFEDRGMRFLSVLFCISGEFRENHGLSSSLSAGFQPGLAALRRQQSSAPVSVTELLGSAQRFPVLGLGPACLFLGSAQSGCFWVQPRTVPVRFSPTGSVSVRSNRFGSVQFRFDRFGLADWFGQVCPVWSRMTGLVLKAGSVQF